MKRHGEAVLVHTSAGDRGEISNLGLLSALHVPPSERELVDAIRNHLDDLAKWNVVAPTANGWRWVVARK